MARSAIEAGFDVVVYARLQDGLPAEEERDGYRVVRAPMDLVLAFPVLRSILRRGAGARTTPLTPGRAPDGAAAAAGTTPRGDPRSTPSRKARIVRRAGRAGDALRAIAIFPVRPLAWAHALEDVITEPADIWHGMWAGSLPVLHRCQRRFGGRTIYDSRDVYMQSRLFATTYRPLRSLLARIERRWAQRADRVLTVNEPYADLLERGLRIPRPAVVMNCPDRWSPEDPRPDLFRAALGLGPDRAIVLYQGQFIEERGIEQAMEAIVEVPDAVLVLLGFGPMGAALRARAAQAPYAGRVFVLPAVRHDELLRWTASADVSVMPIQPTTLNHRYTTPQKLFESLAVGVPVVASDLPGMAAIVTGASAGILCDPTSPSSIATAIRGLLEVPPAERAARGARILATAHERFAWEAQVPVLFEVYQALLAEPRQGVR